MKKKLLLLTMLVLFAFSGQLHAEYKGSVAVLSNSATADSTLKKLVTEMGYNVQVTVVSAAMSQSAVAALDTFKLIIIPRNSSSSNYPKAYFNALTAPVLVMSSLIPRPLRWNMCGANDNEATATVSYMKINNLTHPIFTNVTPNSDGTLDVALSTSHSFSLMSLNRTAGYGSTLAWAHTKTLSVSNVYKDSIDDLTFIAEWAAKQKYSSTSTDSAQGKRMIYLGQGLWPFNSNGDMIFKGIVEYLITGSVTSLKPTDITLSSSSINDNVSVGTFVGKLGATDIESGDKFTYSLVSGEGDTNNAMFSISNDTLKTASLFDIKADSTFKIRLAVADSSNRTFEKEFSITVNYTTKVIFVTENSANDALYVDLLNNNGCTVTVVTNLSNVSPSDSALKVLEASNAIIFSRNTTSGGYSYPTKYNTLATPIIYFSAYMARPSRLQLLQQESITNDNATIIVKNPTHPIFDGVTLGASNDLAINTATNIDVCNIDTTSNANILASTAVNNYISIAEWNKNTKFNSTTAYSAYGHRMVLFLSNTYNLSADGEKLLVNAVKYSATFDYDTILVNQAPTDILLSYNAISENSVVGSAVGTLSAVDVNVNDSWTYALVAGEGDTDNAKFEIINGKLVTKEVFDFETASSYSVRISVADTANSTFEKAFAITVTNVNEAPEALELSNLNVDENQAIGTVVGTLSATDPDAGTTLTYTLATGNGTNDADNASFTIEGNSLKTNAIFDFETKSTYAVYIKVSDGILSLSKEFVINVNDVVETGIASLTNNVRVYPNPFVNSLVIENLKVNDANVTIFDITGNEVFSKNHVKNSDKLTLNLHSGLYFLNIKSEGVNYTVKLIRK
jgi:hypothetical protein